MTEPAAGPTGPGSVVMELGADIGALVLYTPPGLDGEEIEISRDDEPGARRTHSRVRPRPMPGETRYAAVYPGLRAGRYTIWRDERTAAATATVTGGQVSNCCWPEQAL
jgi:hypothetical protein